MLSRSFLSFSSTFFKRSIVSLQDSFLNGISSNYIEQIYGKWLINPKSVHESWNKYFTSLTSGVGFPLVPSVDQIKFSTQFPVSKINEQDISEAIRISQMIKTFQLRGHLLCELDPLGLPKIRPVPTNDLDYKYYGFTESDLEREFNISIADPSLSKLYKPVWKLSELIGHLKKLYCGHVGIEMAHINSKPELDWILQKQNEMYQTNLPKEKLEVLYNALQETCELEKFFVNRFPTVKRFSITGEEGLAPTMEFIIRKGIENGIERVIIGMPHRGRISVLKVIMHKDITQLMADFQNIKPIKNQPEYVLSGDVKYHLGITHERKDKASNKNVLITLMPNPSHLEAVVPLATGRTRAAIDHLKDCDPSKIMCILVHGDAAFSGQGIVYETINMAELDNYKIGGTVHIVVNNQVGFTTNPQDSRSSHYCTDIAKVSGAPILHVNSEDPEAIIRSAEFASEFRQKFLKDVIIDLVGWRIYGHNENDEPRFTQVLMYKKIDEMIKNPFYNRITKKFIDTGVINSQKINDEQKKLQNEFVQALERCKSLVPDWREWVPLIYEQTSLPFAINQMTGVIKPKLLEINEKLNIIPESANVHRLAKKNYEERYNSIRQGKNIAWATAEALAWATLLDEGVNVRISGQDVQRGTFTHRHAYLHNQTTQVPYVPLNNISKSQGKFLAANSNLSEYAVLGYELGYSYFSNNNLVIWEAQFGDFANGGQIAIDNCVVSGEAKWGVPTGIILLLPHGYDGQGAEHSSARIERFLQLSDDNMNVCHTTHNLIKQNNIQCINCTSPANYFHAIRRQIRRDFRKPLMVFASKALYRHKLAVSDLSEFTETSSFRSVITEPNQNIFSNPNEVTKLIFCSGQVYFDLFAKREETKRSDIAIVRVEQLAPYPGREITKEIDYYPNARVFWCQEEHLNMGAYSFMKPRMDFSLKPSKRILNYIGRGPSASTASGFHTVHDNEKEEFLHEAIVLK